MVMSTIKAEINWDWVKKELLAAEKIGSKKGVEPILDCMNACLDKARTASEPQIVYCEKNISSLQKSAIEIEAKITLSSGSLAAYLKNSEKICAFVVTIGSNIEDAASRLMSEGEGLQGYLMDRIGSFAVESLAQDLEEKLRDNYLEKKHSVSMRFSPGYCDWSIEEQLKLDKLIDFSAIGVSLTESCMMSPKKSISAIVGIGPLGLFPQKRKSPCVICSKKDCDYRRAV